MNSTNVAVAKRTRGIAGVLFLLADVVTDVTAVLSSATNGSTSVSLDSKKLANSVADYTDVLRNSSYASSGPIYFFAKLAGLSNLVSPTEASGGGTVFLSAAGTKWSDNRICLVDSCIIKTVRAINQSPLGISAITGGTGGFSIPLSRETLMFLPFLIPIILILIATVAALGFWGKTWQCYPACCSAIGICIGEEIVRAAWD